MYWCYEGSEVTIGLGTQNIGEESELKREKKLGQPWKLAGEYLAFVMVYFTHVSYWATNFKDMLQVIVVCSNLQRVRVGSNDCGGFEYHHHNLLWHITYIDQPALSLTVFSDEGDTDYFDKWWLLCKSQLTTAEKGVYERIKKST